MVVSALFLPRRRLLPPARIIDVVTFYTYRPPAMQFILVNSNLAFDQSPRHDFAEHSYVLSIKVIGDGAIEHNVSLGGELIIAPPQDYSYG